MQLLGIIAGVIVLPWRCTDASGSQTPNYSAILQDSLNRMAPYIYSGQGINPILIPPPNLSPEAFQKLQSRALRNSRSNNKSSMPFDHYINNNMFSNPALASSMLLSAAHQPVQSTEKEINSNPSQPSITQNFYSLRPDKKRLQKKDAQAQLVGATPLLYSSLLQSLGSASQASSPNLSATSNEESNEEETADNTDFASFRKPPGAAVGKFGKPKPWHTPVAPTSPPPAVYPPPGYIPPGFGFPGYSMAMPYLPPGTVGMAPMLVPAGTALPWTGGVNVVGSNVVPVASPPAVTPVSSSVPLDPVPEVGAPVGQPSTALFDRSIFVDKQGGPLVIIQHGQYPQNEENDFTEAQGFIHSTTATTTTQHEPTVVNAENKGLTQTSIQPTQQQLSPSSTPGPESDPMNLFSENDYVPYAMIGRDGRVALLEKKGENRPPTPSIGSGTISNIPNTQQKNGAPDLLLREMNTAAANTGSALYDAAEKLFELSSPRNFPNDYYSPPSSPSAMEPKPSKNNNSPTSSNNNLIFRMSPDSQKNTIVDWNPSTLLLGKPPAPLRQARSEPIIDNIGSSTHDVWHPIET